MGRSATALTWGKRALLGVMAVLLVTFGLRATGSAVAKLDLSDGSLWLASPPMGMVMQVNSASSDVLSSVKVGTGSVAVAQSGHSALVLNRSLGELGRIDGSTLEFSTSPVSDGPSGDLQLVGNEHGAYVLDARGGRILVLDPLDRRLLHEVPVPQGPAQLRIDSQGRLWALVHETGTVVRVDPDGRSTDAGAAPAAGDAALVLVDDQPYLVNPDADRVVAIDDDTAEPGDAHCLGVASGEGLEADGTSGASRPLAVVVDASTGQLVTADLEADSCVTLPLTDAQDQLPASFGQPVTLGDLAFVPAADKGHVLVVDLAENRLLTSIKVVEPGTRFELVVDDGNVWFNSLDGREAGTLDAQGITNLVYKWGEDDGGPGSGDGDGLALSDDGSGVDLDPSTGRVNADSDGDTDGLGPDGLPREGEGEGSGSETSGAGSDRPNALLELLPPEAGGLDSDLPPVPLPSGPSVAGPGPLGGGSTQRPLPAGPSGGSPDGGGRDLGGQSSDPNSVVRLTPEFTYEPRVANVNQPVRFIDTSRVPKNDPAVNSWTWDFGDGTAAASGKDVNHVFSRAGTFTITLTVSNGKETATTVGVAIQVVDPSVPGPAAPDFTFNPQNPQVGQAVRFDGRTIVPPPTCCPVTEWRWDFGDGTDARTGQSVSHTYAKAGEYTVTLTAVNSASPSQVSKPISVAVEVKAPVANFEWSPANPIAGQAVTFRDTSTGGIERRQWSVDGREPTVPSFTYTFSAAGEYVVRLTVSNTVGGERQSDTRTRTISVGESPRAPEITRARANPESPNAGELVNLRARADFGPTSWSWDFGDGSTGATAGGQQSEVTYRWPAPGTYTVNVVARNDAGPSATYPLRVVVVPASPVVKAEFAFNPGTNCIVNPAVAGAPVSFVANASGGTGPHTFSWDFGDGTSGQGKEVSHSYATPGPGYVVSLAVTDGAGNEAGATAAVCVASSQTVSADFTWSPTKAVAGQPVQFTDLSQGSPNGYLWTFGDGTLPVVGQVPNPVHTFALPGSYRVTLFVTREGRPAAPRSQIIEVSASVKEPPVADFRVLEPAPHLAGTPLTLEDTTAGTVAAPVFTITGPGGTVTQLSPEAGQRRVVHTFAQPGTHQVQMTVCWAEDGGNCGTRTAPVEIQQATTPPTATISMSPVYGQEGDGRKVLLAGQPITLAPVAPQPGTAYTWTVNGQALPGNQVTFGQAGDATVTLTAANPAGQAQAVEVVKVIVPAPPVADFDGPASQYQYAQTTFTARPDGHVTSWSWSFSDGGPGADQPTVQRAFATAGEVLVTLRVGNEWGENLITKPIRVDPLSAPTPQVVLTGATQGNGVYTAPAGTFVSFTDASTPPPLTTWLWEFSDGTTADARTVERSFSPGQYAVKLTASNPAGSSTVQLALVVS